MSVTAPRAKQRYSATIAGSKQGHAQSCAEMKPISIFKRALFLLLAGFFFVLALLGVVLPGLPTTPFLLVTSYFLLKSWPAAHDRLLRSRIFGGILRDWQEHRGVRRHVKTKSIIMVGLLVAFSTYWFNYSLPLTVAVIGLALVGICLILKLPELK